MGIPPRDVWVIVGGWGRVESRKNHEIVAGSLIPAVLTAQLSIYHIADTPAETYCCASLLWQLVLS